MPVRKGVRLAVDLGSARIGVARSDPDGWLASPLTTVTRGQGDMARLAELAEGNGAIEVIVGLPTTLSGQQGKAAARRSGLRPRPGPQAGPGSGPAARRALHHGDGPRRAAHGRPGLPSPADHRGPGGGRGSAAGSARCGTVHRPARAGRSPEPASRTAAAAGPKTSTAPARTSTTNPAPTRSRAGGYGPRRGETTDPARPTTAPAQASTAPVRASTAPVRASTAPVRAARGAAGIRLRRVRRACPALTRVRPRGEQDVRPPGPPDSDPPSARADAAGA